mmetsp:Transcript_35622/g.75067  ORF Transcript_35622/g.75067 Transcript_35622/m.75067 type:complete len:101 (+) Transcript_35622:257-559(+)
MHVIFNMRNITHAIMINAKDYLEYHLIENGWSHAKQGTAAGPSVTTFEWKTIIGFHTIVGHLLYDFEVEAIAGGGAYDGLGKVDIEIDGEAEFGGGMEGG